MRKTAPRPVEATVTSYFVGPETQGFLIGRTYAVTGEDARTVWIAEGHDWEETAEGVSGYYPLTLGVFQDPEEAESLIERRAREYTE